MKSYSFKKRQREITQKKKKEEKMQRKLEKKALEAAADPCVEMNQEHKEEGGI